jgi:hypothetical protein
MSWSLRLAVAGVPIGPGETLDLTALRSLVPLVAGVPLRVAGRVSP